MSLATRLTAFFLVALAAVLAGFSVTLYLLAQAYLNHHARERVEAALDTLAAAIDVSEEGLEWEGPERHLTLGQDPGPDQIRWTVHNAAGQLLDQSANLANEHGATPSPLVSPGTGEDNAEIEYIGSRWRVARRVARRDSPPQQGQSQGNPQSGNQQGEKRGHPGRQTQLVLTAGVSLQPLHDTLWHLAITMTGLSVVVLLAAAVAGRWLCRRALAPVTIMARAARAMNAADFPCRLPAAATGDELEDLALAFNALLERLQEAFERQRRFTGDASHQLRTPLAAVLGQVEVALRRERSPAEYSEVLTRVQGQARHLHDIVEMLLFLARADAETRLPQLVEVELADWLSQHLADWRKHPRWPDLCIQAGPALAPVQPALLGQLVDNLLENACKYSLPGTPITIRVEPAGDAVTLTVEDTGPGVMPEDVPYLFEPFFRSHQARRRGVAGVGLGLAVARRIATAFGGTLALDAAFVSGARFVLRLPRVGA